MPFHYEIYEDKKDEIHFIFSFFENDPTVELDRYFKII